MHHQKSAGKIIDKNQILQIKCSTELNRDQQIQAINGNTPKNASCQITIIGRLKSRNETPGANLVAGNTSMKVGNKNLKNNLSSMHCI